MWTVICYQITMYFIIYFFLIQQLIANWDLGLLVIVTVDWQAKQGSLGSGQIVKGLIVPKETPGKNVETLSHVQVTIDL